MSGKPYNPLEHFTFIPIPLVIERRNDLKSISKRVYGYYLKCFGKDGIVNPSASTVASALGKSRKTIKQGIAELKSKKLIHTKKKGRVNHVFFNKLDNNGFPLHGTPGVPCLKQDFTPEHDPNMAPMGSQVPGTHGVPGSGTHGVPGILKDNLKDNLKESEAAPDFLEKQKLWISIPLDIRKKLSKKQILGFPIENIEYAIERMSAAEKNGGYPVKAFQDAIKGEHAKFSKKMEDKEVSEQKQHHEDIKTIVAQASESQSPATPTRAECIAKFRSVMSPLYDGKRDDEIVLVNGYAQFEKNEQFPPKKTTIGQRLNSLAGRIGKGL